MIPFLDPLATIRGPESSDRYYVGTGDADLSKAPLDQYGFPQWAGHNNSHAAGAYQFQPATWAIYASRLGIKDFSPRSQDAVAAACFAARGFADWAPFDTPLADRIRMAGGAAAFSLGASWLAATKAPPGPTGPIILDDVTLSVPASLQGVDQHGNLVNVLLKIASSAAAGMVMTGLLMCCSSKPPQQIAQINDIEVSLPNAVSEPVRPTSWQSIPTTFRLAPGPTGPLAEPLAGSR